MRMRKNALVRVLTIAGVFFSLVAVQSASAMDQGTLTGGILFAVQDEAGPPCIPLDEIDDGLDNDCDGEADNGLSEAGSAPSPVAIPCSNQADLVEFDPNADSVLTAAELGALAEEYPDNSALQDLMGVVAEQGIAGIQYQDCVEGGGLLPCVDQPGFAMLDPNTDDILSLDELQLIADQFPDNTSLQDIVGQLEGAGLAGIQYQGCVSDMGTPGASPESETSIPAGPCQDAVESAQSGDGPYSDYDVVNLVTGGDGEPGNQVIIGTSGADIIDGGAGNDVVCGLGGDDIIAGGADSDELFGFEGDDTLLGEPDDARLDGGEGSDTCDAGDGSAEIENCES